MALIRFAEGQQRSGSIGATVYSRNRFGQYIRARSLPVNPNTARQVAVRNAVRALSIAWQLQLTQFQRDGWTAYAANVSWLNRLGETVKLTGLNHYVRTNVNLVSNAFSRIDDAPTEFNIGTAELTLGVTASEATQQITVTFDDSLLALNPWVDVDGGRQFVFMGLPQNSGIKFFGGPYRLAGVIAGDLALPPTSPELFAAPFPVAEGQRIWAKTRILRPDGRLSEFAQVDFLGLA